MKDISACRMWVWVWWLMYDILVGRSIAAHITQ